MSTNTYVWALILVLSGHPSGQRRGCSTEVAAEAEARIDQLKTWFDLHSDFRRFTACDDGDVAEGWSDFVVSTLANKWRQVPELRKLTSNDQSFRRFVLRHIDPTAAPDDLKRVRENARVSCPSEARALCKEIAEAAQRALSEASK